MSRAEAYDRLGLEEGADQETVRRAYREKVKEVHPDRGGDEAEFRKVTEAYETLAD
jgi:curved DNA-binding protein CbpA